MTTVSVKTVLRLS